MILAPFGLEGTITGREWSDSDTETSRLLDAWRQLYPLEQGCGAVEVNHKRNRCTSITHPVLEKDSVVIGWFQIYKCKMYS